MAAFSRTQSASPCVPVASRSPQCCNLQAPFCRQTAIRAPALNHENCRVERRRKMFRPMTSDVSALSGIVANGHQAIHSVSSAPSKIPYGGFSPVRLQAGCQPCPSPPNGGFDTATVEISSVRVLFRNRARRPAAPTASDTTHLPSGPWLRQPYRLLWPHPSFCAAPPVSFIIADRPCASQKVPTFICQSLMTCRRPYSDGSKESCTNLNS